MWSLLTSIFRPRCIVKDAVVCATTWNEVRDRLDEGSARFDRIEALLLGHMDREEGEFAEILDGMRKLMAERNGH